MSHKTPLLSVVFPVWNEEKNLLPLYSQVSEALGKTGEAYELVFVNNGSRDTSSEIIKMLAQKDPRVRYVSLSKNFGHQGGLLAGLAFSQGDAVITMDADLQHPPSLIPRMIELWKQGYEVVYTKKQNYQTSWWRRRQVQIFYWLLSKLSRLKLSFGQSDFRLLDRKVVDLINRMPEYRKFLRGLVEWVGFRQIGLEYEVSKRHAGDSKFSFRSLSSLALDGILSFSFLPLRWSLWMGLIVAGFCLLYTAYTASLGILKLYFGIEFVGLPIPPGWATLTAAVLFLASIQLIAIGVLSEYVGRIYEQTKGRPVFIVQEASENLGRDNDFYNYSLRRQGSTSETLDRSDA